MSVAAGLLVLAGLVLFLVYPRQVDRNLNDLKNGSAEVRRQALISLTESDLDDSRRSAVSSALEPLLFEGDVRGELSTDLVLRAYLHWAGPDNVPALVRMVQSPTLLRDKPTDAGRVMQALGRLGDPRADDVLAEKLSDPALRAAAVDALRLMGQRAESAVLDYAFDNDPQTRLWASRLLNEYGTRLAKIAAAALARLKSNDPDVQRSAAVWFAENPPRRCKEQQTEVARALTSLLDDLSPRVNALALRALKLWATRDCLPQVVAFAQRDEKAGACSPELIDLLARFPDESAADAVVLQLAVPANRGRAAQALLKLGPVATRAVLPYIDDPDAAVRNEVRQLCEQLKIPTSVQLNQILADLADARKPWVHTALQTLARLRVDESSRARVSQALNALLLDPDPTVLTDALNAVRLWGTKENTDTLLKLLATLRTRGAARDPQLFELLGSLQDPAAAPALAEGLTQPQELDPAVKALVALGPGAEEAVTPYLQSTIRGTQFAACWVLGEIGTSKSLPAVEAAKSKYYGDYQYDEQLQIASEKIAARK